MVKIDSNAILVEPLSSRKDAKLTRAYRVLMLRLKLADIVPKKHVLDNEMSEALKDVIWSEYKMEMELVPPGCHQRNAAEVAICNFKHIFLLCLPALPTISLHMGSTSPSSRTNNQPFTAIEFNIHCLCVHTSQWTF